MWLERLLKNRMGEKQPLKDLALIDKNLSHFPVVLCSVSPIGFLFLDIDHDSQSLAESPCVPEGAFHRYHTVNLALALYYNTVTAGQPLNLLRRGLLCQKKPLSVEL